MAARNENIARNLDCQRCRNPLKFDDEIFSQLSKSYLATNREDQNRNVLLPFYKKELENIAIRRVVLPINLNDSSRGGFRAVGKTAGLPLDSSKSLKTTDTLNNLISDHNVVDNPLCEECTDNILDQMDTQLRRSEKECKMYKRYLPKFREKDPENIEELQAELRKLRTEEVELEAELVECEAQSAAVKGTLKYHEEKAESLEKSYRDQCNELHFLKRELLLLEDNKRSVDSHLMYAEALLNKLANTNVFSATFHIWHSDNFGTINNQRLGWLPYEHVEWPEINAAWGQTVLLLHCMAKKINLTFERYRLVPYGNNSYMEPLDNKTDVLPLYRQGNIKYVIDHRFDLAMVAFLDCLQQFKEKVEADHSFHMPYRMDKGKIEDKHARKSYSVKIHLNSLKQWTKALKCMLTNLKWALAWVSNQFQDDT